MLQERWSTVLNITKDIKSSSKLKMMQRNGLMPWRIIAAFAVRNTILLRNTQSNTDLAFTMTRFIQTSHFGDNKIKIKTYYDKRIDCCGLLAGSTDTSCSFLTTTRTMRWQNTKPITTRTKVYYPLSMIWSKEYMQWMSSTNHMSMIHQHRKRQSIDKFVTTFFLCFDLPYKTFASPF